ncbi:hypothetical protein C5C44_13365 [Rathayibacter sp. AY1F6]|uniref:hypothetical protein n=1 Tax=unclassified Rathayibacter TaxID=2609250 RepID=UPI000CE7D095|nr:MULTISPECIES: hypothetical protein [unclassified Rathayibacter]PPF46340.1 hypothetical protein C5E14_11465 [Rathayibacter sp. AY1A1]PPH01783.1 hypothetical protein C5C44_13365 [Rathayibacter sp. AY1F6]
MSELRPVQHQEERVRSRTKRSGARTWRRLGLGSVARFIAILVAGLASPLSVAAVVGGDDCPGYLGASDVRALLAVAGVASILLALFVLCAGRDETLDGHHRTAGPMALIAVIPGWAGTWLSSLLWDPWDTRRGPEPALTLSNLGFLPIAELSIMLIAATIAGRINRTLPRVAVLVAASVTATVVVPLIASGFVGGC